MSVNSNINVWVERTVKCIKCVRKSTQLFECFSMHEALWKMRARRASKDKSLVFEQDEQSHCNINLNGEKIVVNEFKCLRVMIT